MEEYIRLVYHSKSSPNTIKQQPKSVEILAQRKLLESKPQ
jgi:hypothetical protein